jgi:nifR3 family TIM-barrel protein
VAFMTSFWEGLPKPFFIQAPMEDVTDVAFRTLIARFGKPDVMYTEFTSADGLVLAPEHGKKALLKKLQYSEGERPIVAQLFTSVPAHMEDAAKLCAQLGFDGIDINMGCPDKAVEKSGCGAALIKKPALARELIRAAQKSELPVSVKTRLGYNSDELETWLPELLAEKPAAVAIHARTRKEMSLVPARWERVKRAVKIRDELKSSTLIAGNGDVKDLNEARARVAETGCDGVMLGRAIYGNPWLYATRTEAPSPEERISALIEHIKLFDELLGDTANFATMKKHFKAYISGWDGAKDLRVRLMESDNAVKASSILADKSTARNIGTDQIVNRE